MTIAFVLPARADSLWRDDTGRSMVADKKACGVGDIVTILVQESSTATKDNTTKTAKETSIDANVATFLFGGWLAHKGQMPAMKATSKNDFKGGGTINNSEQIVARVGVQVVDVLPNKHLVIEGRRSTAFGEESQEIVLRGVVRPEDIAANNTVYSYNIADATVKFINKGSVTRTQNKGWFTKIWEFIMPF
jgi:flagellar L-ring protein precursor FlgH